MNKLVFGLVLATLGSLSGMAAEVDQVPGIFLVGYGSSDKPVSLLLTRPGIEQTFHYVSRGISYQVVLKQEATYLSYEISEIQEDETTRFICSSNIHSPTLLRNMPFFNVTCMNPYTKGAAAGWALTAPAAKPPETGEKAVGDKKLTRRND